MYSKIAKDKNTLHVFEIYFNKRNLNEINNYLKSYKVFKLYITLLHFNSNIFLNISFAISKNFSDTDKNNTYKHNFVEGL